MSKLKYYYVTGNTSQGFVNYLTTNIKDIERVIVLKHHSHTIKTAVLKQLILELKKIDVALEILCSPYGDEYLEGIIARDWSMAILSDTVMTSNVKYDKEINLANWLPEQYADIRELTERIHESKEKSYVKFEKALRIHDDLEAIYIKEMNFDQANNISDDFIEKLLKNTSQQSRIPHIYHRLFGTNTDQGPINKLPQIIENISHRVYIKGRAGTGKSVFLNKIIKACMNYGLDIEQYHCSFDPGSTDMVLVPELNVCIFDSTAPHEMAPDRHDDVVIDLYKETVTPGTDEKYAQEIEQITQRYKTILREGINDLKDAKFWQDKIEKSYETIDATQIHTVVEEILKKKSD